MSHVSVKHASAKSGSATNLEETLLRLTDAGPRLLSISMESGRSFVREAASLLSEVLPKIEIAKPMPCPPCEIPETECPPHCVCEIEWDACRGENLKATINVKNTSNVARNFTFSATPFQGPGNPNTVIQFAPPGAVIQPNQFITVTATFTVTNQFQQGQTYVAEALIKGAYEQCVRFVIHVDSEEVPHCEVEQGDIPTRIRAHRWYDHFQCEEPCEQPRQPDPGPGPTGNNPVA